MLIASLIELAIAKTWIWHNHNAQLANFELASLHLSGSLAPLLGYLNANSRGPASTPRIAASAFPIKFDFTGIWCQNAAATKPGSGRDVFAPGSALTLIRVSS